MENRLFLVVSGILESLRNRSYPAGSKDRKQRGTEGQNVMVLQGPSRISNAVIQAQLIQHLPKGPSSHLIWLKRLFPLDPFPATVNRDILKRRIMVSGYTLK